MWRVKGYSTYPATQNSVLGTFIFGIRDIVLDIGKNEFLVLGTLSLIPKNFSCYYQAFSFKLELIEIDFLQENESITISIVLSNSHNNYRLNWNDLDAN
jgi:hypothetical protein